MHSGTTKLYGRTLRRVTLHLEKCSCRTKCSLKQRSDPVQVLGLSIRMYRANGQAGLTATPALRQSFDHDIAEIHLAFRVVGL